MGGIGSGTYERQRARRRYVEECFALDSFDFARQFGRHQRRWLCYDSPWSEGNRFSVSVKPKQGGYLIWAMVLNQELDQPQMWQRFFQIPAETRKQIFVGGPPYWSQGHPLPLQQIGIFAPQFVPSQVSQNSVGASCHWFLCPWGKSSNLTESGEKNSHSAAMGVGEAYAGRCRKLYWRQGRFACRQCNRLGYESQGISRTRRVQEKE